MLYASELKIQKKDGYTNIQSIYAFISSYMGESGYKFLSENIEEEKQLFKNKCMNEYKNDGYIHAFLLEDEENVINILYLDEQNILKWSEN